MIHEKIFFDPSDTRVFLDVYAVNDENTAPRDAMLVIPGGAYSGVSQREGMYTALAFLAKGVNSFVLTYSIGEDAVYPRQLLDAARALKYIKENADKYHIDKDRVFSLGYSAGGHLLGLLTVQHSLAERELGLEKDALKPRGSVFCYPVITAYGDTHIGSFQNLFKKPFDALTNDEREIASIERQITSETAPAFIWHTSEDHGVPIYGSLKLAAAYHRVKTPVELHVYPYGPHATCLATELTSYGDPKNIQPRAEVWVDEAFKWMKGLK